MPIEYYYAAPVVVPVNPTNTLRMVATEPVPFGATIFRVEPLDTIRNCPICGFKTGREAYTCNEKGGWRETRCLHCMTSFSWAGTNEYVYRRDIETGFFRRLWVWWKSLRFIEPRQAPAPSPVPTLDLVAEIARIEAEERQSFAHNPTAFWLAPDRWDGPAKEPFWMRDPRPVKRQYDNVLPSSFSIRLEGDEITYKVDGEDFLMPSQLKPPTLYRTAEEKEFAEFYRSKYKTIGAFRRAKTMRNRQR